MVARAVVLLVPAVLIVSACAAEVPVPAVGDALTGTVDYVYDGDSLRVVVVGTAYDVRLWGIDAPEKDQAGAEAARTDLRDLLDDEEISLVVKDIDDYRRPVAVITYGGVEVNRRQLRRGHAWWYRRYARTEKAYRRAEAAAREAGVGLWAADAPTPPWEYRARQREEGEQAD